MRIIIDLQCSQSESRYRGIGHYSLSLAEAIVRNRGEHQIILVLSGLLPEAIQTIRVYFENLLPQENIKIWYAPQPGLYSNQASMFMRKSVELIREMFIASLKPDVVHVMSFFEGYIDNAVTSINEYTSLNTIVTLYDLIPLNYEEYFEDKAYKEFYLEKVEQVKRARVFLTISEFSVKEAIDQLELNNESVINISGAADPRFKKITLSQHEINNIKEKLGIKKRFILYVGGADRRKNIKNLILAYALLEPDLRSNYCLVIVGKISKNEKQGLQRTMKMESLNSNDVIFLGYVNDEDIVYIYNLSELFIFPSLQEGLGLPALEAMSCGIAVIGSNTTGLNEIICINEAKFDPTSVTSIASRISHVLSDNDFKKTLENYGLNLVTKYSWDKCAKRTIAAYEKLNARNNDIKPSKIKNVKRTKLAFVTPLSPERTGIAGYSSALLPELSKYYDIEIVIDQHEVCDSWVNNNLILRDSTWLKENGHKFDRVLYQIGNSPFHKHMLNLIEEVPGIIVLHDFFLGDLLEFLDKYGFTHNAWVKAIYDSHGYAAVKELYRKNNLLKAKRKYPANLALLLNAKGIIVHSEHPKIMADEFYGDNFSANWEIIPLARKKHIKTKKSKARIKLGLNLNDFIVCSFGFLDPSKLNNNLIEAWLSSDLARDERSILVFVGENHGGEYGRKILEKINSNELQKRILITNWVDDSTYEDYLAATDIAVQLRTCSRGETSAAVLDCMSYAIPTIVNANGSLAHLAKEKILMIADQFKEIELVLALESLFNSASLRDKLGQSASKFISEEHDPAICASQYANVIEKFYLPNQITTHDLINSLTMIDGNNYSDKQCIELAQSISVTFPRKRPNRQFLIDITATYDSDLRTGIERVAKSLCESLLIDPPNGFCVEPIYLSQEGGDWCYKYARSFTLDVLDCPPDCLEDEIVEFQSGDILLGVDLSNQKIIKANDTYLFKHLQDINVCIYMIVYDLLPILMPKYFPPGADVSHQMWLQTITQFSGAICISRTTAIELYDWMELNVSERQSTFKIGWIPLSAEIKGSESSLSTLDNADQILSQLRESYSFLMVGTIEPRKGYAQTLAAFTTLWEQGENINLVIVGKEGWVGLADNQRRNIPEIIKTILNHSEYGKRLFWLDDVSDGYLDKIYSACNCLVAASEGEGFCLPLIEAANYGMEIIARDIEIFKEVLGEHAYYFSGLEPKNLVQIIGRYLTELDVHPYPYSKGIEIISWKESAKKLLTAILEKKWYRYWVPGSIERRAMHEHLSLIHAARVELVQTLLPQAEHILDLGGANSPLYRMGYPHSFSKLTMIDLPVDERHELFKDAVIDDVSNKGEVVVHYGDMTSLDSFADESIDFVWSGQSIEHVPPDAGEKMCREAFRVLKSGGAFCLDTPNRLVTEIHTKNIGGGFIHPEHCIEYTPEQLGHILEGVGFTILKSLGLCEMVETVATGQFKYSDFLIGRRISENINGSYIQYFHCVKP